MFHPVIIPTLSFYLLFNSGFYFSLMNWEAKRFVLLVVFFSTGILPMLSVAVLSLNSKFDLSMENKKDRIIALLFSSVFYYTGYILLSRMKAFPVFNLLLIASVLVIVVLLLFSFKIKISSHMAAIGAMTGTIFSLSFRSGANPVETIIAVVLISGLVGTALMQLKKFNLIQLMAGYLLGFSVLYSVIYFL